MFVLIRKSEYIISRKIRKMGNIFNKVEQPIAPIVRSNSDSDIKVKTRSIKKQIENPIEETKTIPSPVLETISPPTPRKKKCNKCGREIMLKSGTEHPYWWHTDGMGSCSRKIKQSEEVKVHTDSLTTLCHNCDKTVELRWSKNGKPYWRHLVDEDCVSISNESITHRYAKEDLVRRINNCEDIKIVTNCQRCGAKFEETIPEDTEKAVVEHRYNNINGEKAIFDIACLNKEGQIVLGIEIFYKHETNNKMARQGIKWVEVMAVDVLKIGTGFSFTLNNNLKLPRCEGISCLPLSQVALDLGYLVEPIPENKALSFINLISNRSWRIYPSIAPETKLSEWKTFTDRKCCLRCGRTEETKYKKPFCVQCYKDINRINSQIPFFKSRLGWLDNIPDYGHNKACAYCEKTYMNVEDNIRLEKYWGSDNRVSTKLRYKDQELRCCTVCLEEKLIRLNIINETS